MDRYIWNGEVLDTALRKFQLAECMDKNFASQVPNGPGLFLQARQKQRRKSSGRSWLPTALYGCLVCASIAGTVRRGR
jgi:hypothetical protein